MTINSGLAESQRDYILSLQVQNRELLSVLKACLAALGELQKGFETNITAYLRVADAAIANGEAS